MNPNDTHREQLSALFDGALDADQSRFLLRRLQHDGELAASLSSWQLAGDVLRGQADAPAPHGFAETIAARIAGEPLPLIEAGEGVQLPVRAIAPGEVTARVSATAANRWRWFGGGAMAASLAIASVLALRPDTSPTTAPASFASTQPASPGTPPAPQVNVASVDAIAASTSAPLTIASAANGVSSAPPAAGRTTTSRANAAMQTSSRVARATAAPVVTRERDVDAAAPRMTLPAESAPRAAQAASSTPANPFTPPVTKPWPRAVIPGAGNGTFNASLDSDTPYYPFAPSGTAPTDQE